MTKLHRFDVRCDDEWRAILERLARRRKFSAAEAVRQAVVETDALDRDIEDALREAT